jgi:hypothetical protein
MSFLTNIASSAVNFVSSFINPSVEMEQFDPTRITLSQATAAHEELVSTGLPPELALIVLDYAEYWVHEHFTRTARLWASAPNGATDPQCASLYTHTTPLTSTLDPIPLLKPRKVTFKLKSKDQGWSDNTEDHGTYKGSFSWFEAAIFLEDESFEGTTRREPLEGLLLSGVGSQVPQYQMASNAPLFFVGNSPEDMMRTVKRNGYECRRNGERLTWLLQRNRVASQEYLEHTVEWTLDDGARETREEEWSEDGAGTGRGFVNALQSGDRIGVWARAMVSIVVL